jgi:hypothetical protein
MSTEDYIAAIPRITSMMRFLDLDRFVIPTYNIPFPHDYLAMVGYFRPNTIWRMMRDGTIYYEGIGFHRETKVGSSSRIWVPSITMSIDPVKSNLFAPYIFRAHSYLLLDCQKKLSNHITCSDIPNIAFILKSFHKLDFFGP